MSNILRKMERDIVKAGLRKEGKSVKQGFDQAWKDYREKKYVIKDEDGNVIVDTTPKNTQKKKQNHFDSVDQYTRVFAYMDALKNAQSVEIADTEE